MLTFGGNVLRPTAQTTCATQTVPNRCRCGPLNRNRNLILFILFSIKRFAAYGSRSERLVLVIPTTKMGTRKQNVAIWTSRIDSQPGNRSRHVSTGYTAILSTKWQCTECTQEVSTTMWPCGDGECWTSDKIRWSSLVSESPRWPRRCAYPVSMRFWCGGEKKKQ
jgi:hypothetical protein